MPLLSHNINLHNINIRYLLKMWFVTVGVSLDPPAEVVAVRFPPVKLLFLPSLSVLYTSEESH